MCNLIVNQEQFVSFEKFNLLSIKFSWMIFELEMKIQNRIEENRIDQTLPVGRDFHLEDLIQLPD